MFVNNVEVESLGKVLIEAHTRNPELGSACDRRFWAIVVIVWD